MVSVVLCFQVNVPTFSTGGVSFEVRSPSSQNSFHMQQSNQMYSAHPSPLPSNSQDQTSHQQVDNANFRKYSTCVQNSNPNSLNSRTVGNYVRDNRFPQTDNSCSPQHVERSNLGVRFHQLNPQLAPCQRGYTESNCRQLGAESINSSGDGKRFGDGGGRGWPALPTGRMFLNSDTDDGYSSNPVVNQSNSQSVGVSSSKLHLTPLQYGFVSKPSATAAQFSVPQVSSQMFKAQPFLQQVPRHGRDGLAKSLSDPQSGQRCSAGQSSECGQQSASTFAPWSPPSANFGVGGKSSPSALAHRQAAPSPACGQEFHNRLFLKGLSVCEQCSQPLVSDVVPQHLSPLSSPTPLPPSFSPPPPAPPPPPPPAPPPPVMSPRISGTSSWRSTSNVDGMVSVFYVTPLEGCLF